MVRIVVLGLTVLALAACKPVAEGAPSPVPAATASAAPVSASEAAWRGEVDRYLGVNVQPSEPVEAVMWRAVRCDYLGGELGGDNPAQDQAIDARMDELRCGEELTAEARELRQTLAGDPAAVARLDVLLARGEPSHGQAFASH